MAKKTSGVHKEQREIVRFTMNHGIKIFKNDRFHLLNVSFVLNSIALFQSLGKEMDENFNKAQENETSKAN